MRKKLSNRWYTSACPVEAHRDLYRAWLTCAVPDDKLIADQAQKVWTGLALRYTEVCITPSTQVEDRCMSLACKTRVIGCGAMWPKVPST